jgi:hypothetical protein
LRHYGAETYPRPAMHCTLLNPYWIVRSLIETLLNVSVEFVWQARRLALNPAANATCAKDVCAPQSARLGSEGVEKHTHKRFNGN